MVRAKENIKVRHGVDSQRQAPGTNKPINVLGKKIPRARI